MHTTTLYTYTLMRMFTVTSAHVHTLRYTHIHIHILAHTSAHISHALIHTHTHARAGGAVLTSVAPPPIRIPLSVLSCTRGPLAELAPHTTQTAALCPHTQALNKVLSHPLAFPKGKETSQSGCYDLLPWSRHPRVRKFFLPATFSTLQNQDIPVLMDGEYSYRTAQYRSQESPSHRAVVLIKGRGFGGVYKCMGNVCTGLWVSALKILTQL